MVKRSFFGQIRHWFTPHATNNYRARLLKHSGLVLLIGIVLSGNLLFRLLESTPLHILGFSSSVNVDEVVRATNRERLAAGLPSVSLSTVLSDAARRKAANMLEENYWAHNSPSGKTPWVWFNAVGYKYTFAGENLAKDFGNTERMMEAWMNSPTHKANIVNGKYTEMGIAVVPGNLQGQDTVLVVQMFGATGKGGSVAPTVAEPAKIGAVQGKVAAKPVATSTPIPLPVSEPVVVPVVNEVKELDTPVSVVAPAEKTFMFDQFMVKKALSVGTVFLFLLALIADLIIAETHSLSRRVGKNWGHIVVLNVILLLVVIVQAGSIR